MFKCARCVVLEAEVLHLRDQNEKLVDRLMAMADAKAYGAIHTPLESEGFYGGKDDEMIDYDLDGQRIVTKRK